ncbi:hypothetical protein N9C10_03595 [Flavobacteriaceae bacterium]|nr:hypothetical protein [Flavobacteriaceae bacterium]
MMFKNEVFTSVKAVLVSEEENNISEIDLDISSEKREIFKILKGPATIIGQCYVTDVVAMKCRHEESQFELMENRNTLPKPFNEETGIIGSVLLVRMNKNALPEDFTISEYTAMKNL